VRRASRRPPTELTEEYPSDDPSPLEITIQSEKYQRYRTALAHLTAKDRELVLARLESQWSFTEIAQALNMTSPEAARMAVTRAIRRLDEGLNAP
jgi:RNA polymerase sigma factor (sigma-70 family)